MSLTGALSRQPLAPGLLLPTSAGGGGAPFAPTDIPGLQLWLKADTGTFQDTGIATPATADADPVGSWRDQSGVGNHVIQATAGKRPLLKLSILNGKSVIRWDATDDCLRIASFAIAMTQPYTVFVVCSTGAASGAFPVIFDNSTAGGAAGSIYGTNDAAHTLHFSTVGSDFGGTAGIDTTHAVIVGIANGASSQMWKNGTSIGTGDAGAGGLAGISLGINRNDSGPLTGDMAEFLLYSGALSQANIDSVESYLGSAARWGITVV